MRPSRVTDEQVSAMDIPPFLRIEDAARILDISRSTAYEQTALWLHTGGLEGLPVIRIGRCLRVPRPALLAMLGSTAEGGLTGATNKSVSR